MNFVPVLPLRASLWAPVFQVISSRNSVSEFSEFKIFFKIKIRPCRRLDATHSERWLKYVFSLFFCARKLKKCKKEKFAAKFNKKNVFF